MKTKPIITSILLLFTGTLFSQVKEGTYMVLYKYYNYELSIINEKIITKSKNKAAKIIPLLINLTSLDKYLVIYMRLAFFYANIIRKTIINLSVF